MFSDQAVIIVNAGNGGNGSVSFRRERFVPKGGPDGGDGGKGGDVIIQADLHHKSLIQLYRHPHWRAEDGKNGRGQRKNGKDGNNLTIYVPVGTLIEDESDPEFQFDLSEPGKKACVALGGSGGKGNIRFKNSIRQSPRFAQKGELGQSRKLRLNLKLIADVGLVGFPNAGKSTLISRISAAKPKIANYPFTTMEPHLGVVYVNDDSNFIMADIPGLIKGAHRGVGLGDRFLKHIERTKILLYILDGYQKTPQSLYQDYKILEKELYQYASFLQHKEKVLVINKCDLPEVQEKKPDIRNYFQKNDLSVFFISAITGTGTREIIFELYKTIKAAEEKEKVMTNVPENEEIPHYRYEPDFTVLQEGGLFVVKGEKVDKLAYQFDLNNPQALSYFQKKIKDMGVEKALRKEGARDGDQVKIGKKVFYFYS